MKYLDFWPKKIFENRLTKGIPSGMIVKLARAKAKEPSEANLENDTGKWKRKTTVNSEMSFSLDRGRRPRGRRHQINQVKD